MIKQRTVQIQIRSNDRCTFEVSLCWLNLFFLDLDWNNFEDRLVGGRLDNLNTLQHLRKTKKNISKILIARGLIFRNRNGIIVNSNLKFIGKN